VNHRLCCDYHRVFDMPVRAIAAVLLTHVLAFGGVNNPSVEVLPSSD
jgi:hypothetical protein